MQSDLKGLTEDQTKQFLSLVTEYEDIFLKDSSDLGKSGRLEHAIDTVIASQLISLIVEYYPISEK